MPESSSARPVAQVLAVAALVVLLSVPVLSLAGMRRRGNGWSTALNATVFLLWCPVAYSVWILLGTIAGGGCDSS